MSEGTIVVGVDASQEARAALEWAIAEARLRGAPLRVVHAFAALAGAGTPTRVSAEWYPQLEREAEEELREVVAAAPALAELAGVEEKVMPGNPAHVLVEESRDAGLLVVGSRGRGGFAGLLLGSVSQQCVQHAHCPVVVVRG